MIVNRKVGRVLDFLAENDFYPVGSTDDNYTPESSGRFVQYRCTTKPDDLLTSAWIEKLRKAAREKVERQIGEKYEITDLLDVNVYGRTRGKLDDDTFYSGDYDAPIKITSKECGPIGYLFHITANYAIAEKKVGGN